MTSDGSDFQQVRTGQIGWLYIWCHVRLVQLQRLHQIHWLRRLHWMRCLWDGGIAAVAGNDTVPGISIAGGGSAAIGSHPTRRETATEAQDVEDVRLRRVYRLLRLARLSTFGNGVASLRAGTAVGG